MGQLRLCIDDVQTQDVTLPEFHLKGVLTFRVFKAALVFGAITVALVALLSNRDKPAALAPRSSIESEIEATKAYARQHGIPLYPDPEAQNWDIKNPNWGVERSRVVSDLQDAFDMSSVSGRVIVEGDPDDNLRVRCPEDRNISASVAQQLSGKSCAMAYTIVANSETWLRRAHNAHFKMIVFTSSAGWPDDQRVIRFDQ